MIDRAGGGLIGLLVGDALGVPYEFHEAWEIPPRALIEFEPPPGFLASHGTVPTGTWSDDGSQALALLASLLDRGRLDLDDFAERLLMWSDRGEMAVDGRVFDVGNQTARALGKLRAGASPRESGPAEESANGNGSLMRALPVALWHKGADAELARDAAEQSLVTHAHPRSMGCCALYCLWARRELGGVADAWASAVEAFRSIYAADDPLRAEVERHARPDEPPTGTGGGYVVDCLNSARMVVDAGSTYEEVVKSAVALGEDTDTTACVAGGIAGIRYGLEGIPSRWQDALRGRDLYRPRLDGLRAWLGGP